MLPAAEAGLMPLQPEPEYENSNLIPSMTQSPVIVLDHQ